MNDSERIARIDENVKRLLDDMKNVCGTTEEHERRLTKIETRENLPNEERDRTSAIRKDFEVHLKEHDVHNVEEGKRMTWLAIGISLLGIITGVVGVKLGEMISRVLGG